MARATVAEYGEPATFEHSIDVSSDKKVVSVPSFAVYSVQTQLRRMMVAVAG